MEEGIQMCLPLPGPCCSRASSSITKYQQYLDETHTDTHTHTHEQSKSLFSTGQAQSGAWLLLGCSRSRDGASGASLLLAWGLFLPQGIEPLDKTVWDSKNRDGYSTVSHRGLEGRSECPAAVPRGLSGVSSAQRRHPEGDSPDAGRSPLCTKLLSTSRQLSPNFCWLKASTLSRPLLCHSRSASGPLAFPSPGRSIRLAQRIRPRLGPDGRLLSALSPLLRPQPEWSVQGSVLLLQSEGPASHPCPLISWRCWPPQLPRGKALALAWLPLYLPRWEKPLGLIRRGPGRHWLHQRQRRGWKTHGRRGTPHRPAHEANLDEGASESEVPHLSSDGLLREAVLLHLLSGSGPITWPTRWISSGAGAS